MKKLTTIIIAIALFLGMSQCKKNVETITPSNQGKTVHITVNVSDGSKHIVYPGTGAVVYTDGDVIYVGDGSKYLGTLTYGSGAFSGDITEPAVGDYLYFYFLGGLELASPSAGTTSYTVSIADQSSKLPVLSFGRSTSTYTTSSATYGCTLENKCGLVKFTPATAISTSITVGGMKTEATIDFATPGIKPTETTGTVTLYSESNSVKWAILLPQDAVNGATVDVDDYSGTCDVPAITNNMFYTTGIEISLTAKDLRFSVGASTKVLFAPGNLRATNTTENSKDGWTWSFAPNQYSIIGNATANTAVGNNVVTTDGTVDLFGWVGATSSLAAYGINNNTQGSAYGNTVQEALRSDWGVVANAANLGGHNDWRTLTKNEWVYVFQTRANASQRYGHGSVNGVNGMIILPDVWVLPSGLSFTAGNSAWTNSYTTDQWEKMEENGAVFLPAAGRRMGSQVLFVGSNGYYWSSSSHVTGAFNAYFVSFGSGDLGPQSGNYRYFGNSVRLARVVK